VASKTVVELFDDLDGSRADETVTFGLDGVEYQIDLSAEHAAALRAVLARFIPHAHRPAASRPRKAATASPAAPRRAEEPKPAEIKPPEAKGPVKVINHTEEIRRLAKLSAQQSAPEPAPVPARRTRKSRGASTSGAVQPTLDDQLDLAPPPRPVREESTTTLGPAKALTIPFQEAGL
jgi:hypothetical protein